MKIVNKFAIFLIRIYQFISRNFIRQKHCRFYPTCSEYAVAAFTKYGFFKAFKLTAARISKCHPWHDGGYDPLP